MYQVYLERAAERDLRRLAAEDLRRVVAAIARPAENPRPAGCRKLAGSANDCRIKVGVYRVLYEIDDSPKVVRVMRIKHRREAYR